MILKNIKLLLFVLVIAILSCRQIDFLEENHSLQEAWIEYDDTKISRIKTHQLDDSSYVNFLAGPYMKFYSDGNVKMTGVMASVEVPSKFNVNHTVSVKKDKWYYFGNNGKLDSIVIYKKVTNFEWKVDSVYKNSKIYAIDSSLFPIYDKKIIYSRN